MLDTLDIPPQKLPVTIVTGFLGSGKTTLLNHIIQNFEGYKVAVLVNEFGDINIDSQLLVKVGNDEDENTIELTNGCICCTINDDFADAVYRILIRRDRVDYLIVETTGVANPLPIAMTFLGTDLRDFTHLDSIVTVVDAESFNPREHYESDVAIDQLFCGDIIILNKTDLVSHEKANKTEDFLRSVKEGARILRSEHGKVPLSLMLDTNLADPDFFDKAMTNIEVDSQHLNNDEFTSVSFQSNRPLALKKFQQFLDVAFQPKSGVLASLAEDGWIVLWQAAVEAVQVLDGAEEGFCYLAGHPTGCRLAAGGRRGDLLAAEIYHPLSTPALDI